MTYIYAAEYLPLEVETDNYVQSSSHDSLYNLITLADKYSASKLALSDSLIRKALSIYSLRNINNDTVLADCYHILGKTLVNRKKYSAGIDTLKKSVSIKKNKIKEDPISISKTLNYIGIGYLGKKEYDSADYYFNKSKLDLISNEIYDINLFYVYHNQAILNAELGKYTNTTLYLDSALLAINRCNDKVDSLMIGYFYNTLALFTTLTGNLTKANSYFEDAENIFNERLNKNSFVLATLNNNKGVNSYHNHDLSKAELYYKKALNIYLNNNDVETDELPKIYYNLSQISQEKENYQASIEYCLEGLKYNSNLDIQLILYNGLAKAYSLTNDYKSAARYFAKTLNILEDKETNPKRYFEIYLSYADFLTQTYQYAKALEYYQRAITNAKLVFGELSEQTALTMLKTAEFYLDCLNKPETAITYYDETIDILEDIRETNFLKNTSIIFLTNALSGKGRAFLSEYNNDEKTEHLLDADTNLSSSIETFENVVSKLSTNDKLLLLEDFDSLYNLQINNLLNLHTITGNNSYLQRAFQFIEKSKSSALLSSVNSENALKTSDLPDDLFQYEHKLKDNINGLQQLLEKEKMGKNPDAKKVTYFEKNLLENIKHYDSLIAYLELNFPKYYSLKYNNNIIDLDQIESLLEPDELIIEYHYSHDKLTIAAINNEGLIIKQTNIDSTFHNALDYILNINETNFNDENKASFYRFKKNTHYLWKKLIMPVEEYTSNKRLIIIPDGKLGYLPFDVLTEYDFEYDGIDYRDLPYLINSNPLSYAYSVNLLFNTYFRSDHKNDNTTIMVFAPDYTSNTTSEADQITTSELKFAKQEAQNIVKNYGGTLFTGTNASKENFKIQAPKGNILHLSMHALINDSLPMQSRMIFSVDDKENMHAHEVFNLDLTSEMVVLSACNTGSGKLRTGEGIISMARGFLYAGVPSIVMTLWEAQDETGALIMENFYKYLNEGMTKDRALQMAKTEVLKDANMAKAHPFFWSSYIISGDTKPVQLVSSPDNINIIYLILAVVVIYIIARFVNKKLQHKQ